MGTARAVMRSWSAIQRNLLRHRSCRETRARNPDGSGIVAELTASQTSNCRIIVNSEVTASVHDDGLVILHTRSGRLFSANQTGARIWCCIERQIPPEAIADEIGSVYQIAPATAREHTTRFLAELERNNLIERGSE